MVIFKGTRKFLRFISALRAERLMKKGNIGYLAYIVEDKKEKMKL